MMKNDELLIPPLLEELITNTLNKKIDIWQRQSYRTRLAQYRDILVRACDAYDLEMSKSSNTKPKKKVS